MIRGYQSFRLIPSSKLLCPMVFPPFFITIYMKFLVLRILSILSVFVPVYCNVFFSILFFPLVTLSDVLVRFSLFPVPYSSPVKVYVLGGPYLLCLDFMIYNNRCLTTVVPLFQNYLPISLPALSYSFFIYSHILFEFVLMAHWSVPPLSCSIFLSYLCPDLILSFIRRLFSPLFTFQFFLISPLVCTS